MDQKVAFAIDFGTSTTLLAIPRPSGAEIVSLELPNNWMPSAISSADGLHWEVGENAFAAPVDQRILSLKNAITHNVDYLSNGAGQQIDASEAIGLVLARVASKCQQLGLDLDSRIRMSCPAMWDGPQRKRLVEIAQGMGFNINIDDLMDEPIAAGISWWWNRTLLTGKPVESSKVVVFDLGGGTLDIAVLHVNSFEGKPPEITVLAARGIDRAGDEVDVAFAEYINSILLSECNFDYSESKYRDDIYGLILRAARETKEKLSHLNVVTFRTLSDRFEIPSLEINRSAFTDNVLAKFIKTYKQELEITLREARLKQANFTVSEVARLPIDEIGKEIDFLVMAGGMAQIPDLQDAIHSIIGPQAKLDFATANKKDSAFGIVEGLANPNDALNLNVHRPNFDFLIEYEGSSGKADSFTLYPAFQPIYTTHDIMIQRNSLYFEKDFRPKFEPLRGIVHLKMRTIGGRFLTFLHDGVEKDSIELHAHDNSLITFRFFLDGRFVIHDGLGYELKVRIRQWPFVRWGANSMTPPVIELENANRMNYGQGTSWWDFE